MGPDARGVVPFRPGSWNGVTLQLVCALFLAGVHLVAGRLRSLEGVPRSGWLSFAGGVAIAYVFVHLLPDLAEADETLASSEPLAFLERHGYLVALVGLSSFYALESLAVRSRAIRRDRHGEDVMDIRVMWLHAGSYGAYNALIGYLVARGGDGTPRELLLFTVAMAVHFLVADVGLRDHHGVHYDGVVRWVLAAALLTGFVAGELTRISEAALALLLAFLAGAVVLNTLKEEVPSERQSRLGPFLGGAAAYAAILVAV